MPSPSPSAIPEAPTPWWRDRRVVPWLVQAAAGLVVLLLIGLLINVEGWRWWRQPSSA